MDSNYYGTLAMIRGFAPVLARNGGGAILNVLSAVAWQTVDGNTAYAANAGVVLAAAASASDDTAGECVEAPGVVSR